MNSLKLLFARLNVLLASLNIKVERFNQTCTFIEEHASQLSRDDRDELFAAFLSIQLYVYIYQNHLNEECRWVELFEDNEFQLQQCGFRLKRMSAEMDNILEKVMHIKQVMESKLS